jgi:hypothetical protein
MPLESTGTTDFDEAAFPDAIRFWMKVKDAEPPKPVRIIVTAGALEQIDLALDQYGLVEIFKKHRASIEAAASDKFDRRGEDEMYEGMPVVRVFQTTCQACQALSGGRRSWLVGETLERALSCPHLLLAPCLTIWRVCTSLKPPSRS